MDELLKWLPAIVTLLGVVVSAILNHRFSRANEDKKRLDSLRGSAYAEYLDSMSGLMILDKSTSEEKKEDANGRYLLAQSRPLLFASRSVLDAYVSFKALHATSHGSEAEVMVMMAVCQKMRDELLGTHEKSRQTP